MSDENENGRPGGRAPITLKPRQGSVSAGVVKQSFSHGRTKTVVVETKRTRPHAPATGNLAAPSSAERRHDAPPPRQQSSQGGHGPSGGGSAGGLSQEELRARQRVVDAARENQARQAADQAAEAARVRAAQEAAQREAAAKAAVEAAQEAEAQAWLQARRAQEASENS